MTLLRNVLPVGSNIGAVTASTGIDLVGLTQAVPPDVMMHHALNPVSRETSILYPAAAESYFLALGDLKNADFTRRLRVANRVAIAFDLLLDRCLFDLVEELQDAWINREKTAQQTSPHLAEDYEDVANAFRLALADAEGLSNAGDELPLLLGLASSFQSAIGTMPDLKAWTSNALLRLCPDDGSPSIQPAPLMLLGARLFWNMQILRGAAMLLGNAASGLKAAGEAGSVEAPRHEGFVRYARALTLLLNRSGDDDMLRAALEELERAIVCFRRTSGAFPSILYRRLSETHELLGRDCWERGEIIAAGYHLGMAREVETWKSPARLPEARVVSTRRPRKTWRTALKSLLGWG